jgi:hypothetical protein
MSIALTIFPAFSDKTLPLGLACLKTVLDEEQRGTAVFDFDYLLSVEDRDLYYAIHDIAVDSCPDRYPGMINFIGGRPDVILPELFDPSAFDTSVLSDTKLLLNLEKIDCFLEQAVTALLEESPHQIWISTYISNLWISLLAAKKIRQRSSAMLVFGGPAVFTKEVHLFLLHNHFADAIIVGEGELSAREFLRSENGHVDGVAYLDGGHYRYVPRREALAADEFPMPDFKGFPFKDKGLREYLKRRFEGIPVSFSRGCINACIYCSEKQFWRRFRYLSVEQAVGRLRWYIAAYGISSFYLCDSLVNFSHSWLSDFCDRILAEDFMPLFTFAFCDLTHLSPALLGKMSKAGFSRIAFGLESGSPGVLGTMNKAIDLAHAQRNLIAAATNGLPVQVSTIVNFPGEESADVLDTIRFFREIDERLALDGVPATHVPQRSLSNRFRLEPSTDLYLNPGKYGIVLEPIDAPWTSLGLYTETIARQWRTLREPSDRTWNTYLASHFSNKQGPWRLFESQFRKQADSLRSLIDDDTCCFTVSDHVVLQKNLSDGAILLKDYDDEFILDAMQSHMMWLLSAGSALCELAKALEIHDRATFELMKAFVLNLYVRGILRIKGFDLQK